MQKCIPLLHFNPRSPCGERQCDGWRIILDYEFQSTLPVRGATADSVKNGIDRMISIHAPRAGSDAIWLNHDIKLDIFQSTLPVRGATAARGLHTHTAKIFQSTLPVRGATCPSLRKQRRQPNFNPRSPCGERHDHPDEIVEISRISIHAPRAGSDLIAAVPTLAAVAFQSTLPVRGATFPDVNKL